MMKIERGKSKEIVFESLFQIFLLVMGVVAFSYFIGDLSNKVEAQVIEKDIENYVCCEKTKTNAFCQNTYEENCDKKYRVASSSCEKTDFCRLGCCYDSKEGICAQSTPRRVCEERNGTFDLEETCNIPQCALGCCVLGGESNLATLVRCKKLANFYGLNVDFRSTISNEFDCINVARASEKGACVFEKDFEKTCKFTTRENCAKMQGKFNVNMLCSAEELGTNCARQHHTGCVVGKDEVYWFDSCGNPENIYDANKERSYNNGRVLPKELSCNYGKSNANSASCGNCDYLQGSRCGVYDAGKDTRPTYGNYICKSLDCAKTSLGVNKKHGESWCEYDSIVGNGADVVGSRHWRHICVQGEELVEPCDDYRQTICLQANINTSDGSIFTAAACRANRWQDCTQQKSAASCLDDDFRDCRWIDLSGINPNGGVCVPNVPPGLKFWEKGDASTICSSANLEVGVVYVKEYWGDDYKCKENCWAMSPDFHNKWIQACRSLGDCGAKINIVGQYSGSYNIDSLDNEGKRVNVRYDEVYSRKDILGRKNIIPGFAIVPLTIISKIVLTLFKDLNIVEGEEGLEPKISYLESLVKEIKEELKSLQGAITKPQPETPKPGFLDTVYKSLTTPRSETSIGGFSWFLSNVIATAILAGGLYMASRFLLPFVGVKEEASKAISAGVAAGVGTYGVARIIWGLANKEAGGIFVWESGTLGYAPLIVGLFFGLLAGILVSIYTYKEKSVKIVTLSCYPWRAPKGGADCEKCNNDPFKPCSEYRCKSLGGGCQIVNKGTDKEKCVWISPKDVTSPTIKPLGWPQNKKPMEGLYYANVKERPPGLGFEIRAETNDGCLKAWTPLEFGVETNELSQCKIDYNSTKKFEEMTYWMGESTYYDYNHTQKLKLPGPQQIKDYVDASAREAGITPPKEVQMGIPELKNDGQYTLFIRCRDGNGNENIDEYAVRFCVQKGPDLTPPVIERTSLQNGAGVFYGAENVSIEIKVNEPSDCRWDFIDRDYEDMKNNFVCEKRLERMTSDLLYSCVTTLTNIDDNVENTYYFRCKDQPWLNESERNVNKQSYIFRLQGTVPLNIISTEPNGTIKSGTLPARVILKAETANGFGNDHFCFYSTTNFEDPGAFAFFNTRSKKHEQELMLLPGFYNIYLTCSDLAGNIDKKLVNFTVEIDKVSPQIIRAYHLSGLAEPALMIVTDEKSSCKYSLTSCNFEFDKGIDMPFAESIEHSAKWKPEATYYIKCKDIYGNVPIETDCSAVIKAYEIVSSISSI